jgi:hypothetical protein
MKFATRMAALSMIGIIASVSALASPEMEERAAIEETVKQAFFAGRWAQLENTCSDYRKSRSRTPSGVWKLSFYHAGIEDAIARAEELQEREAAYRDLDARIAKWLKAYPASPCPHLAVSDMHIAHAWSIRGDKFASQVAPEAWAPFRQYIQLARKDLEEHKSVAAVDPGWYSNMLLVAQAQGWERREFDQLLNEALTREPLYYPNYFGAIEYLLPKWHGDASAIEAFARDAVRRTSKSEGRGMYARIYWYASQTDFQNKLFTKSQAVWPMMKSGFDDVIARYPDAWNLNNYAKFACLAHDRPTTKMLLKKIESQVIWDAWDPRELLDRCKNFVDAEAFNG